jgi:hypothetical protein
MKNNTSKFWYAAIFLMTTLSCTKNADLSLRDSINELDEETAVSVDRAQSNVLSIGNPYSILLESVTNNGDNTWTWVWSVQNPNPGNGNNGTAQGVSHWGFSFGSCVIAGNLVNAGYSQDGNTWTDFNPGIAVDGSQSCFTRPVVKFEFETNEDQKTWYRLVVNKDLPVNNSATGYYKSGSRTGCGTFTFAGIGCGDIIIEIIE